MKKNHGCRNESRTREGRHNPAYFGPAPDWDDGYRTKDTGIISTMPSGADAQQVGVANVNTSRH
jgi:hypothetical protein